MGFDDSTDNHIDVCLLIGVYAAFMKQFLNDIRKFFRQGFPYFRTGIFRRNVLAYLYQLVQGNDIPVFQFSFFFLHQLQLLFGIVNQGTKLFLFRFAQGIAEYFVYFSFNGSRGVAQYVLESLILSVQVGKEMFGAFRQVQNRFQVNNFGTGGGYGRKVMRKQFKVTHVFLNYFRRDLVVRVHGHY